jgi:hypothetical protein
MFPTLIGIASDLVNLIAGAACFYVAVRQLKSKKGPENERSEDDDEGESG